jgi:hypothetical protein
VLVLYNLILYDYHCYYYDYDYCYYYFYYYFIFYLLLLIYIFIHNICTISVPVKNQDLATWLFVCK